jgi:hypothetical protein
MLPFSASERAQARAGGNDDGSFFFPLLARKEGRSNPAPKGAARFARSVRRKSPDGMALPLHVRKDVRHVRTGVNSLAHEEDRRLAGVPARHYVLQKSVAQSWPREA